VGKLTINGTINCKKLTQKIGPNR